MYSNYRIWTSYHTYPYKHTVKQFRGCQISVLYFYLLVEAIQMSTIHKENQKKVSHEYG